MKKTLLLTTVFILVLVCTITVTSCNFFRDNNQNSSAEIIQNGIAQYMIVYPENRSDAVYNAVNELVSEIQELTGVRLTLIKATKELTSIKGKYILIGTTPFEESHTEIKALPYTSDAYVIKSVGENIIFGARGDDGIIESINYTKSVLEKNYNASTKTLYLQEHSENGNKTLPDSLNLKDISKYSIIYSSAVQGFYEVAEQIATSIKKSTGYSLSVSSDQHTPETEYEILIGNTNRHLSHECYSGNAHLMEYSAVVKNGQLQIVCGGPYSARLGATAFLNTYLSSESPIAEGTYLENNLATETVAHTPGTDVRIMTANLLAQSNDSIAQGFLESVERAEIFAKILVDYTPDFIGIQEADNIYTSVLPYYYEVIYQTYGIEYSSTKTTLNGSPIANYILYRSDKYTLDYQKAELPLYAAIFSDLHHSVLSSAKFTDISDPTIEIAILSAHWHWQTEAEASEWGFAMQEFDADQMASEYKAIQAKYPNAKIFCTGDFNSHRFSTQLSSQGAYLNMFLREIKGEIASTVAKRNDVLVPSFTLNGRYIDHIIGAKGTFDVLYHSGTNNRSNDLTDHQPVYADIQFIK